MEKTQAEKLVAAIDERENAEANLRNAVAMQLVGADDSPQAGPIQTREAAANRYVIAHMALDKVVAECDGRALVEVGEPTPEQLHEMSQTAPNLGEGDGTTP